MARSAANAAFDLAAAIHDARIALGRGDTARAVDLLAEAWAARPSSRLANITSALSSRLPVPPLRPGRNANVAEREAWWLQLAAKHQRASLPTLLAVDWPVHPRAAKARLEQLLQFPPDPRIALALHDLWQSKRYRSSSGYVFWRATMKTLVKWGDPLVASYVSASKRREDFEWFSIFEKLDDKPLPTEPVFEPAVEADVAALEADLAATRVTSPATREQLFEAVYDDPASDLPRAVLADALLADGDPRGELIQLQLLEAPRASAKTRIKSLLRTSGAKWLDGLDGLVVDPVFRRGFVAEAGLAATRDWHPERRAWRTVEALRCSDTDGARLLALLGHDNLSQLRRIEGLRSALGRAYLATATRDLDRLELLAPLVDIESNVAIRIRELVLSDTYVTATRTAIPTLESVLQWFERSALRDRVASLVIDRFEDDLPGAYAWFVRRDLASLALRPLFMPNQPMAWELVLSRDPDDRSGVRLDAIWNGRLFGEREPEGLGAAIARLPADALTSIVVGKGVDLALPLRERLTAEIARALAGRKLRTKRLFD